MNDRRQEYYVNKSLCEDDWCLEKLLISDNGVKSVCQCRLKTNFTINTNAGINDDIPLISTYNAKSFLCPKRAFSKNLANNAVFWIFIILIIFFILLFLIYILYGSEILKKIFHFDDFENEIDDKEKNKEMSENSYIKDNSIRSNDTIRKKNSFR